MKKLRSTDPDNNTNNLGWVQNQRRHLISAVGLLSIAIVLLSVFSSFALSRFEKAAEEEERAAQSFWSVVDHTHKAENHFRIQIQEWKNTLLRGHIPKDYDKYFLAFNKQAQLVDQNLKAIKQSAGDIDLDKAAVASVLKQHQDLTNSYLEAAKAYGPNNIMSFREVDKSVRGMDRPFNISFANLNALIYELAEGKRSASHDRLMEKSNAIKTAITVSAGISIMLAGFTLFFALRIISVRQV